MGRSYIPKNPDCKPFDVNYSGADILGCLMKTVNEHSISLEKNNKLHGFTNRFPSTVFTAEEEDCIRAAIKLEQLPKKELEHVFRSCSELFERGSTIKNLEQILNEWNTFLKTCKGFEVN